MRRTNRWLKKLVLPAGNKDYGSGVFREANMLLQLAKPFAHHNHPREIVRQFTPNWFTVTMGTGVVALALNQFAADLPVLHQAAAILWLMNIGLFALCSALYGGRWIFFTADAMPIWGHPVMPMFLGAIPMGLATIINGFLVFGIPHIGAVATQIALVLWWVDVVLAAGVGLLVPYLMFTRQQHSIESMTAVWLLPVVPAEVAAASGGLLVQHIADPVLAAHLLFGCYLLWAFSLPLALGILVILFLRLVLHKLPKREMAVSSWLALGPLGTGSLALMVLGRDAPAILGAVGMGNIGAAAQGIGVIGGLILWGYGAWWLIMAAAITLSYVKEGLPFNLGWWGFTFPLGVFTLATLTLGVQTGVDLFAVLGGAMTLALLGFWITVAVRTISGGYRGNLFHSPCLAERDARLHASSMITWPE
jgi:C4-dicarboxylate transporter/malic acid transport protein